MLRQLWIPFVTVFLLTFSVAASAINYGPGCSYSAGNLSWAAQPPARVLAGTEITVQAESSADLVGSWPTSNWTVYFNAGLYQDTELNWGGFTCNGLSCTYTSYATSYNYQPIAGAWQFQANVTTTVNGTQETECIATNEIAQVAPTAQILNIGWTQTSKPATFTGTGTEDPNAASSLSYTWNFGDNSTNGQGATVTHTYSAPGTYTVELQSYDGYFYSHLSSQIVTVVSYSLAAATIPVNIAAGIE